MNKEINYQEYLEQLYFKHDDSLENEFIKEIGCSPDEYYSSNISQQRKDIWIETLMDNYCLNLFKKCQSMRKEVDEIKRQTESIRKWRGKLEIELMIDEAQYFANKIT